MKSFGFLLCLPLGLCAQHSLKKDVDGDRKMDEIRFDPAAQTLEARLSSRQLKPERSKGIFSGTEVQLLPSPQGFELKVKFLQTTYVHRFSYSNKKLRLVHIQRNEETGTSQVDLLTGRHSATWNQGKAGAPVVISSQMNFPPVYLGTYSEAVQAEYLVQDDKLFEKHTLKGKTSKNEKTEVAKPRQKARITPTRKG